MKKWTIVVGRDLTLDEHPANPASWGIASAQQARYAGEQAYVFLFPERFLHPDRVRADVMPRVLLSGWGRLPTVVVTHSQTILTLFGDIIAAHKQPSEWEPRGWDRVLCDLGRNCSTAWTELAPTTVRAEDVEVHLYTRAVTTEGRASWQIDVHTFDENGSLSAGWPFGYLEP